MIASGFKESSAAASTIAAAVDWYRLPETFCKAMFGIALREFLAVAGPGRTTPVAMFENRAIGVEVVLRALSDLHRSGREALRAL